MSDIFGRTDQVFGGGLTSDASWMFWAGLPSGGLGMLVTQMSIQYQQPIRKIFEIGPWTTDVNGNIGQPVYYIAGRPEGQLQLSRIAGPVAAIGGFYRAYGNVCSFNNSLLFVSSSGCLGGLPAGSNALNPVGASAGLAIATGATGVTGADQLGRRDPFLGWYMNGVTITNIGLAVQSQEMLVNESVSMMFLSLKLYTATSASSDGTSITGNWTQL